MLKYQTKTHHLLRTLYFVSVLLCVGYNLCALHSLPDEDTAASFMMQPFDLKALMKHIIDDARERNNIDELPHSFIACYEALEKNDPLIQSAYVVQIVPFILNILAPEMMERTISYS